MVLNRKLKGLSLPEHTRIVSAMNPIGDEYDYDLRNFDPALYDRFNVYTFIPM
jgi:MoxR-like ATPase